MIRLTWPTGQRFYLNPRMIISIQDANPEWNQDGSKSLIHLSNEEEFGVMETPEQIVSIIQTAEK